MDTPKNVGADLQGGDEEARREAARMMGKARTKKKIAAARAVAENRRGVKLTPEQRERQRQGQIVRWERIRQERLAAGVVEAPQEKKPVGRPRTRPVVEAEEKRPRGRPKKQSAPLAQEE